MRSFLCLLCSLLVGFACALACSMLIVYVQDVLRLTADPITGAVWGLPFGFVGAVVTWMTLARWLKKQSK